MNLKVTLCLLCLFALFSCKKSGIPSSDAITNFETDSIYVPLGGFYQSQLQEDSTFICMYSGKDRNMSFFFSDTINMIYAGKCQLNREGMVDTLETTLLLVNEWSYLTIDSSSFKQVVIQDMPYLYFATSEGFMGQGIIERNVNFHLLNMDNLEHYRLLYAGVPSFKCEDCIDGSFVITEQLKGTPEILDALKELSKTSTLIYQRGPKDDDIYYHMNYEEKWEADNKSHNAYAAGYGDIVMPIRSTYYATNLFDLNRGSENDVIENDKYQLRSYFRGNIVGYDKSKKMHFPLYIESCVLGCNKNIEFIGKDSLKIVRSETGGEEYRISMKDIIFDTKTGD